MTDLALVGSTSLSKPIVAATYPPCVRKVQFMRETVFDDSRPGVRVPVTRVVGAAVLANAWCDALADDLGTIAALGEELASAMMPELLALLGSPAAAYGKAAIIGTRGQLEHGAALLHPQLGRPVRQAIGGGAAVIPSNNKIGAAGSPVDVPLGHKDDAWSFAFIDTLTQSVSDAPREDEMVLFVALASGRRPAARIGVARDEGKLNGA